MGLKIITGRDGKPRGTWYGYIIVHGKTRTTNLNVPIAGTIPMNATGNISLTLPGDAAFERSRAAAQKAFDKWKAETKADPAQLQVKAYKARTGETLDGIPLSKLAERWGGLKRECATTAGWQAMVKTWFDRFATFAGAYARNHGTRCETINDVTPAIAGAWFDDIKAQYSWETVTKMMNLMRGAFRRFSTNGKTNPFADIIMRGGGTGSNKKISRKPLTGAQLEKLFAIADGADVYPLIVAAACTGMRIGDVCNLKWADVDLKAGLIECVTAKAGVRVTIPIFDRLREVLEDCAPVPGDGTTPSPFVFPSAAAKYNPRPKLDERFRPVMDSKGNPVMVSGKDAIIKSVQPFMARAVFGDAPAAEPALLADDEPRVLADVIGGAGFTDAKRARLLDVYARNKAGERSIDIAAALNITRSQVSMDLRDIEKLTGENLRPMAAKSANRRTRMDLIEQTREQRTDANGKRTCKRAASVYGWHSLRHTFVVLALDAGVPVESVRKIVGHGEATTTIDNYFNPTKEHEAERVRAQMAGTALGKGTGRKGKRNPVALAAPGAITTPAPSIDDLIGNMSEEQRKALARRLLGL